MRNRTTIWVFAATSARSPGCHGLAPNPCETAATHGLGAIPWHLGACGAMATQDSSRGGVPRRLPELFSMREARMKRYKVILHRTDEGISVSVPGLPGCWSEGDTEEEALENIQDAIQEYLAALEDQLRGAGCHGLVLQPVRGDRFARVGDQPVAPGATSCHFAVIQQSPGLCYSET